MNNIELNFIELNKEYPHLHMEFLNDKYMIEGKVRIYATNDEVPLIDDFTIVMEVPLVFPKELPIIRETSNKISILGLTLSSFFNSVFNVDLMHAWNVS